MVTSRARMFIAALVAGTLLVPSTAAAARWDTPPSKPNQSRPAGMVASGVSASAYNGQMTALTNTGRLGVEELAWYGFWCFPGQTVNVQLATSNDFLLVLENETDELAFSDEVVGGTESIAYTNEDYAAGPQFMWIGVGAYVGGNYTMRVSMTDPTVTSSLARIAGSDRYATSVKASQDAFADGSDAVVIATGGGFADALAAAGLCGAYDAPLLLVPTGSLPAAVSSEIDRLGATRAVIVGGTGAVSSAVQTALGAKPALSGRVSRIAGANRFDTAKRVAEAMRSKLGTALPEAIVVNGANFADALSASPLAFADHRPILLTPTASAHQSVLSALDSVGAEHVTIVGGAGAVGTLAEQQIESHLGAQADRWAGANRFDTARIVAENSVGTGALSREFIGYSHGFGFADGLAGGVAAGKMGGVLLLTESFVEPEATEQFNVDSVGIARSARVFGGSGVVWGSVLGMVDSDLQLGAADWTDLAPMPTGRFVHSTAVADGKILAIGGHTGTYRTGAIESYDPATDEWTTKALMHIPRHSFGTAVLNGKVYTVGGAQASEQPVVEAYDPVTEVWSWCAFLPTARHALSAVAAGGKVYALGGFASGIGSYRDVDAYDPASDTWTTKAPMRAPRHHLAAVECGGKIYAIGGFSDTVSDQQVLSSVEAYDPATNTWTTKAPMNIARWGHAAAVVDGKIYVFGGTQDIANDGLAPVSFVEMYDPATNTWSIVGSMKAPRPYLSAEAIGRDVYVVGGREMLEDGSSYGMNTVERYTVPE